MSRPLIKTLFRDLTELVALAIFVAMIAMVAQHGTAI